MNESTRGHSVCVLSLGCFWFHLAVPGVFLKLASPLARRVAPPPRTIFHPCAGGNGPPTPAGNHVCLFKGPTPFARGQPAPMERQSRNILIYNIIIIRA